MMNCYLLSSLHGKTQGNESKTNSPGLQIHVLYAADEIYSVWNCQWQRAHHKETDL